MYLLKDMVSKIPDNQQASVLLLNGLSGPIFAATATDGRNHGGARCNAAHFCYSPQPLVEDSHVKG